MLKINSIFILLCFACDIPSYTYSYSNQVFKDLKRISTPDDLAQHIEVTLASHERRWISPICRQHLNHYAKSLLTFRLWALRIFDASAKLPPGLLRGYGAGLGAFDECLNVKNETKSIGTIRGKYCLGGIRLLQMKNYGSANDKVNYQLMSTNSTEPRFIDFAEGTVDIVWGVCLPDSCTAKDFQILHKLLFMEFSEDACQTIDSESKNFDSGDIATFGVLGVIAVLMILSTIYDLIAYYLCKERDNTILRSFSIVTNIGKIISASSNETEITCIYGLRVLSVIMLLYGYRYVSYVFAPLINWFGLLKFITNKDTAFIIDAVVCGDTFFVISGFLVSYNYFKAKNRGIRFNVLIFYLRRILRLTPALGMAILIHATLMRHIGSGPVWPNLRNTWLVNTCKENWWTSLLYVQNYVTPDITRMCMLQTWHIAVDMQLFILSPVILLSLSRWPRYTVSVVLSLLFAAILSPFLAAWVYKLKAVVATTRSLHDVNAYMQYYFLPTHTRAAPWIIGFLLGYIIHVTNNPHMKAKVKQKLTIWLVLILWGMSLGLLVLCILIGREMIGIQYHWVTNAFHMSLIRPAWSISIVWMIFACVHGYGGPVNSFLSTYMFAVLSKISYSTYLVHFTMLFLLTYQTRQGVEFSHFDAFYRFLGDIFPSLALGLVWTLAFESPFITIGKVIFRQPDDRKVSPDCRTTELSKVSGM